MRPDRHGQHVLPVWKAEENEGPEEDEGDEAIVAAAPAAAKQIILAPCDTMTLLTPPGG